MERLTRKLKQTLSDMKQRCYNKNCKAYNNYGGRGIVICEEWLNDSDSFCKWCIENGASLDLSIDRINNDGNYEPSNCRWATPKQQSINKRNTRKIEGKTLEEISNETGIDLKTIQYRYDNGYKTLDNISIIVKDRKPKLNYELACEIRNKYKNLNISQRGLAKKYGVSKTTIRDIVKGVRYNENKRTNI